MGVGFRDWTTRHGGLIGGEATVVQVDADPTAFGRHRPVDVAVVGDVAETARAVTEEIRRRGLPAAEWRTDALVQFPETDLAAWAAAFGIASCRVGTLDDLEPVQEWINGGRGPMLADVRIDPDVFLDWAAEAFKGH